jgi:hypothetical protein
VLLAGSCSALLGGVATRSAGSQHEATGRKNAASKKESDDRLDCGRPGERSVARPDGHLSGVGVLREAEKSRTDADTGDQERPQCL